MHRAYILNNSTVLDEAVFDYVEVLLKSFESNFLEERRA